MDELRQPGDWRAVLAAQQDDGSFLSHVRLSSGAVNDRNVFATALVLDRLRAAACRPDIVAARNRALDFLQRCADPSCQGRFGFYRAGHQPAWMLPRLAPDADDTALCNLALLRAGRIDRTEVCRVVREVLLPFRLLYRNERSQPWHRIGALLTWLDPGAFPNPVDCTVNVNVLMLLHASGELWPEAGAITEMLHAAVDWAGGSKMKAVKLSPWYPEPIEFVFAVERAAAAEVPGMAELSGHLQRLEWVVKDKPNDLPICGSSDGRIVWTCPALRSARAIPETGLDAWVNFPRICGSPALCVEEGIATFVRQTTLRSNGPGTWLSGGMAVPSQVKRSPADGHGRGAAPQEIAGQTDVLPADR
ncbi:hypothetical protein [Azospirillum lipoferum]|uniref:hypothetical protein n=1 Tax=Azospirillum lipoferum TaxID=193 RepID=UPI001395D431|nr:hypothetical protein [Azospirillum lipoferum]